MANSKLTKVQQNKSTEGRKSHFYLPTLLSQKEAREAARAHSSAGTIDMCRVLEKEEGSQPNK